MIDPRVSKMADVLVGYCLALKPGSLFRIEGPYLAEPLIREVYRAALQTGANPFTRIAVNGMEPIRYRYASEAQLKFVSELELREMEKIDARLTLWCDWNTRELTGVDSHKIALVRGARKELFGIYINRVARGDLRWCGTLYPSQASAQDAEMSLEDYEEFVFNAMHLDKPDPIGEWQRVSQEQARLVRILNEVREIEMKTRDTSLKFRCAGRKWVNCDGKQNFPDGEIFTCPIEDSVEGTIRFSFPAIYSGKAVEDVRLRFVKGKVVEARAAKGEDLLNATLDTDAGARYAGEISFGTNFGIQRFTRNTLFDEKIGGTMHVAVGASLKEAGGVNESAIHWDIVADFRDGGEVYADGRLIHKDGKFLI
jgi:aminopeptidase